MKKLVTLVLLGALLLSALPLSAMAYFPTPPEPEIAMQINGQWSDATHPVVLTGLQYCNTLKVEVFFTNVVDLYAYDFVLTYPTGYLSNINYTIEHNPPFATDFVLISKLDPVAGTYEQAVTATAPTPGFNGTAGVAILYFHFDNQAQWPKQVDLEFDFTTVKASTSCTLPEVLSVENGYLKLKPIQPYIDIDEPASEKILESVVGTTFTVQFTLHDVVKMKSFHIEITYDPVQLSTDAQNVFLKNFLPPPYESVSITFGTGNVTLDVQIPCEKPSVNGTGELFGIRFKALNPWKNVPAQAPGIPPYSFIYDPKPPKTPTHKIWFPDNCWNYINLAGYIDKVGGELQHFGTDIDVIGPDVFDVDSDPTTTTVTNMPCPQGGFIIGYYEFRPVPGDLDLDGHADVIDLAAIAKYYGRTSVDCKTPAWATIQGFDLTLDGVIDIYDVVIVSKNICRTTVDPVNPFPLPDP